MKKTSVIAETKGQRIPSYADGFVQDKARTKLSHLVAPHVDSFNYFLNSGLDAAMEDLPAQDMKLMDGPFLKFSVEGAKVGFPRKGDYSSKTDSMMTPRECRERGLTYAGGLQVRIAAEIQGANEDGEPTEGTTRHEFTVNLGNLPIMVKSEHCNLYGKTPEQLTKLGEEANEVGGYFIMNGIERVIRLLQVPRRNFPAAIERGSYANRGKNYSNYGVSMRCVRPDQTSVTLTLHYLATGAVTLRFVLRKQEFLLPVGIVLKALGGLNDKEIYDRILQDDLANTFLTSRVEVLLRDSKQFKAYSKQDCLIFIGSLFRSMIGASPRMSDERAGHELLRRYVLVHTNSLSEKTECLLHMTRKLYAFAEGKCQQDNQDALCNHELLLPGHLYTMYVKEKVEELILKVRQTIQRDFRINKTRTVGQMQTSIYFQKILDRMGKESAGKAVGTFLSTGNVVSSSGMDLSQVSGFTIVAERLNYLRYMSHFQSVHRGQYFTTMKTTAVRKLLPESWGFLCPVHTPDGSPCGLLNHLARNCILVSFPTDERMPNGPDGPIAAVESDAVVAQGLHLRQLLVSLGMRPCGLSGGDGQGIPHHGAMPVCVDGVPVGSLAHGQAKEFVALLRILKITGRSVAMGPDSAATRSVSSVTTNETASTPTSSGASSFGGGASPAALRLDNTIEVAYCPRSMIEGGAGGGVYPGIYLFTSPARMLRPVLHLGLRKVEYIGPMEQVFMDIACTKRDIIEGVTTHLELEASAMLSHVASMTPFSDYNQSPRNMYQCQMGKQTMGTPAHALRHRTDNKLYRIQNPQAPIVQNATQREYQMDEYPQGTNAIVAVIAYTGYDMEDAMIINKGSFDRGFGDGCMYKTIVVDLALERKRLGQMDAMPELKFCNVKAPPLGSVSDLAGEKYYGNLDIDGLPLEGDSVEYGDPIACYVDESTGDCHVTKHKEAERAHVQTVRVLGSDGSTKGSGSAPGIRKVTITLRFPRRPIIGDKFSSRHGQKGTLSVLWPQEDMPFTESGMSPDILINPHAFPSRMTIGMLLESMAGKAAALHGFYADSSPFQFHEQHKAVDFVGEQLKASGYHYYGSEPLYSGIHGTVMKADIFIGVVFYQRLRHMVSDKAQVRNTGAVMGLTRQPVKGRKKGGGIRLGEMERDALLSHGASFCLHDRLMNCSDKHLARVCQTCGGLLSVRHMPRRVDRVSSQDTGHLEAKFTCSTCNSSKGIRKIHLPYIYRYLTNELAGMGIKLSLKLSE